MVLVVGAVVVVVVAPEADDPVTVSVDPASRSETAAPLRLGSGTRVTGPLSTAASVCAAAEPEGP